MRLFKTEAIVLKSNLISETNKIATLFTKTHGKIQAVAKGARRSKSRFINAIRPFVVGNYLLFEGQNYYYIDQWDLIELHPNIETDLIKFSVASYFVETMNKILEEHEKSDNLYLLLKTSLKDVDQFQIDPLVFISSYNLKLMALLGYMPQLNNCVVCGRSENLKYFSSSCGGTLCTTCKDKCRDGVPINETSLKVMWYLLRVNFESLQNIKISSVIKKEVDKIITDYMKEHLGLEFASKSFIDKLKNI
ncbi:DNA repair protein RecO [Thermoanaerobacter kivui]|uniref:DNA repair protein RecO n=1 Tax=Thermoanaerobacter kivui TaxID=2325 RepID=A0A097AQW7_THEKI|nr:DNA repair protein RecO [Thermoanaerobacter kivui]AIS52188.1 DNA repair protein RecO [Thermoanaerobacter kivui]